MDSFAPNTAIRRWCAWLILAAIWAPHSLCAAEAIIAQALPAPAVQDQLQQERERALRNQMGQSQDVRVPRTAVAVSADQFPENETPCFPITHIVLVGESAEQFQFALKAVTEGPDPALGRCLGAQGINVVLTRVQNAIVAKGYVTTRVLVTPQDIKSGELALTVIPGRISAIRFTPDSSTRVSEWNALPISMGDLLNLRDIEQGLENFKRVPTADADIQIEPATSTDAKPGESDLVIRYRQDFPLRLTLSADDGGLDATGKTQGGVTVSCDNCTALNDLFYFNVTRNIGQGVSGEHGTRSYTVNYIIPFGYWLLSVNSNKYHYDQTVAGATQSYLYSGDNQTSDIKLSRLVYRDAVRKISASLRAYLNTYNNFIDDTKVEVQSRRMAGWQGILSHREFIGASTLDGNLAWRRGTGAFNAMPAPEEAFNEGTARPKILTTDANLNIPFAISGQQVRYNATWRAQWNYTPLISQDRFSIGGRYTVRGFDGENVLMADRGWLIRNDLALPLGDSGQELYWGVDYGHVGGSHSEKMLGNHLSGTVLGLRGAYKRVSYDAFVGTPLYKPNGFTTSNTTAGFNVSWSI